MIACHQLFTGSVKFLILSHHNFNKFYIPGPRSAARFSYQVSSKMTQRSCSAYPSVGDY